MQKWEQKSGTQWAAKIILCGIQMDTRVMWLSFLVLQCSSVPRILRQRLLGLHKQEKSSMIHNLECYKMWRCHLDVLVKAVLCLSALFNSLIFSNVEELGEKRWPIPIPFLPFCLLCSLNLGGVSFLLAHFTSRIQKHQNLDYRY